MINAIKNKIINENYKVTKEECLLLFKEPLEQLAAAAGVSRISIVRYESGERFPDVDVAARIAKVLNCKVDDLIDK